MTKEKFIEFIKELGFNQTWGDNSNGFIMQTDVYGNPDQNSTSYPDQLNIYIDEVHQLAQLSLTQLSSTLTSGKKFGNFSLKTFGDKDDLQQEIFLSFILSSFNKKPDSIIKYMRDRKIENILK
jgi:hypothetical protein